jgi:histidinol-phosphate aminotransferase
MIVLGNGADSILINLSLAMLEPGDEVVFGWPSFITYPLSVCKVGAVPVQVPLDAQYRYDLDAMRSAVTPRTRFVYVCNPNNPTGTYVDRDRLTSFVASLPSNVLCVVDEAYHEYVTAPDYPHAIDDLINAGHENVMVLRTLSKIYGLAGLRVGWGVAPPSVVRAIDTVRGPFEMNALANEAALASVRARVDSLDERVAANEAGRAVLTQALENVGLRPLPSVGNFVCVVLDAPLTGRVVADQLEQAGVIVRPLDMFGMPEGIRITVGTPEENDIAIAAIARVLPALVADARA